MKLSDKKMRKKKEDILLSAIKVVNKKGPNGATMEDIAAELLMTKGSLYYYFKNKEDIIFQCHEMVLTEATSDIVDCQNGNGTNEEKLLNMIKTHIRYAIEKKEIFNMMIKPGEMFTEVQLNQILHMRNEYALKFDETIVKGIASGEFVSEDPVLTRMMILGAMNWIQQWYRPNGKKTINEIQEIYAASLLKLLK
ncbi:TetR/AcrR family transcriptional regulator [Lysinibacillus yapensis]|uniref:TetR/AcrR family transcriptional regulator n=1 Tax=Ureibacillus yapensis TaxID=2304605 RepID=A0A396SAF7_9BACL|nr:TetR/AcrR family transcriptional regulator [Lysinibacillus yapensis]RHW38321.1 TetR/AcrR family transcriptional regulator [Lysinibacillus yapensis]